METLPDRVGVLLLPGLGFTHVPPFIPSKESRRGRGVKVQSRTRGTRGGPVFEVFLFLQPSRPTLPNDASTTVPMDGP